MIERRQWPRYSLEIPIRIEALNPSGMSFVLPGKLRNISARGALADLPSLIQVGTRVRLDLAIPFSRLVWLSYEGEVVRLEATGTGVGTAIRFTSVRPSFLEDDPGS